MSSNTYVAYYFYLLFSSVTTTIHVTLMITFVQVVETSVTTTGNSPSQDYTYPYD